MDYHFNQAIEEQLFPFEQYMQEKGYAEATLKQMRNYAGHYLRFVHRIGMQAETIPYQQFVQFILEVRESGSAQLASRILLALRHYYQSLGADHNPTAGIYIRTYKRSVLSTIVPYEDLLALYRDYPIKDDRSHRNKVILGLYIFQAMTLGGLHRLEPQHIDLKRVEIRIPQARLLPRTLAIDARQVLELQQYVEVIRPRMLERIHSGAVALQSGKNPLEVAPRIEEKLLFSEKGSGNLKNSLFHLFRAVRKQYPKIISGKVIRATVMAQWLTQQDIRKVQYMPGHHDVSSTEQYDLYFLKGLKDQLDQYHPLAGKQESLE